jgi:hypothetical protein
LKRVFVALSALPLSATEGLVLYVRVTQGI